MTLFLDHLHSSRGVFGRFDPRWKLASLGSAAMMAALLHGFLSVLLSFVLTLILVFLSGMPWSWYARRLGAVAVVMAFFVVWLPVLVPGDGLDLGLLHLSLVGLTLAAVIALKAFTIVSLMLLVWATAPVDVTLKAAHALHVPALIVQLLVHTYRYIFLLGDELARLRVALRVRGYRNRPTLHSYRTVGHVTGTLLIRGYERAERIGQAMRCRGFDGRFRALADFQTRPADVAGCAAIVLSAAALLICDLLIGP